MSNPFEDPDVANAKSYGNSAYDEPKPTTSSNNNSGINNETGNQVRASIALNVNQNPDSGNVQQPTSQTVQNPPTEPDNWFVRAFKWVQVRWFAFIGGLLLILLTIVGIISRTSFVDFFVLIYLVIFGILMIIVESPTFVLTRKSQLGIFFWFRLLARTWGRAWFYLFVAIICFYVNSAFAIFVGIWVILVSFTMFLYSRLAALDYVRIYIFVAAGQEGPLLQQQFDAKFDELDLDRDGRIGSLEIVKVAKQAGCDLSNTERHAIQSFLDASCNGNVSKEDWWKQFSMYNINQKFL